MLDPESILRLYANVLHNDIVVNRVPTHEIRKSVQCMAHVYSAENATFEKSVLKFLNFNDAACRCAYLHKYAPLHTHIAFDAVLKIFHQSVNSLPVFRNLLANNRALRVCSLGGGPGSDVIGVVSALRVAFNTLRVSASIVDCMAQWECTFRAVLQELKFGGYGPDWYYFANDLRWSYLEANLLCDNTPEDVREAIASASLITMMKFISASACTDTEEMVDKIFRVMKVGALVLYIDNAAGGFTQLIERSSQRNGLVPVAGPFKHVRYDAEALRIQRFGYTSCYQTKVTIMLLQKSSRSGQQIPLDLQEPRPKLDFVVFDNCWGDSDRPSATTTAATTPLNVNVFSPDLNNASDSKYPEKLNNLNANTDRTSPPDNFTGFATPPKSPDAAGTPPRKPLNPFPNRKSQPVARTTPPQRYQPLPPVEIRSPPQEVEDDPEEAPCSCCVIS